MVDTDIKLEKLMRYLQDEGITLEEFLSLCASKSCREKNGVSIVDKEKVGWCRTLMHCSKCGGYYLSSDVNFDCPICESVVLQESDMGDSVTDLEGNIIAQIKGKVLGKYLISFTDGRNIRVTDDELLRNDFYYGTIDDTESVADKYGCLRHMVYYDRSRDIVYSRVNDDFDVYISTYKEYICGDIPGYKRATHLRSSAKNRLKAGFNIIVSKILSSDEVLACDIGNNRFVILDSDDARCIASLSTLPIKNRVVLNEYKGVDAAGFPYLARIEDGKLKVYYSDYNNMGISSKKSSCIVRNFILENHERAGVGGGSFGEYMGYIVKKEEFRVGEDIYYKVQKVSTGDFSVMRICDIDNEVHAGYCQVV